MGRGVRPQPGRAVLDRHCLPQRAEQLDQQLRDSFGAAGGAEDVRVGSGAEDVLGDPCGRPVVQRSQRQLVCARLPDPVQGRAHSRRHVAAAHGDQPQDRVRREAGREGVEGEKGQVVAPLEVVEDDEQGAVSSRLPQAVPQFLEQPEALAGRRGEVPETDGARQRLLAGEQTVEERAERHELFVGVRRSLEHPRPPPPRGCRGLREDPGPADADEAFDADDPAFAPVERVEPLLDERQFGVPAAQGRPYTLEFLGHGPRRHSVHAHTAEQYGPREPPRRRPARGARTGCPPQSKRRSASCRSRTVTSSSGSSPTGRAAMSTASSAAARRTRPGRPSVYSSPPSPSPRRPRTRRWGRRRRGDGRRAGARRAQGPGNGGRYRPSPRSGPGVR